MRIVKEGCTRDDCRERRRLSSRERLAEGFAGNAAGTVAVLMSSSSPLETSMKILEESFSKCLRSLFFF